MKTGCNPICGIQAQPLQRQLYSYTNADLISCADTIQGFLGVGWSLIVSLYTAREGRVSVC